MRSLIDQGESNHLQDVNILVVEDDPITAMLLKDWLEYNGACVSLAECATGATALSTSTAIDLCLVGICSPKRDGFKFIRKLWQWESQQPQSAAGAIALMAEVTTSSKKWAITEGFTTYISQPFESLQLLEKILELLDK